MGCMAGAENSRLPELFGPVEGKAEEEWEEAHETCGSNPASTTAALNQL